jgi:hypothetical protein
MEATYVSTEETSLADLAKKVGKADLIIDATGSSKIAFNAMEALGHNGALVWTSITGGKHITEVPSDKINIEWVLGNKLLVGSVNANREHFESGIKDLALGEVMYPGVIEKILTNPVEGLGNYKEKGRHWDVIQFNHGLHDLKQVYDAKTDTFGAYSVSMTDYKTNLEKQISILNKTGAKLIWCATTPVPNDNKSQYARRKGACTDFNKTAMEVMAKHPEIRINDLHATVTKSPVFDNWRKTIDVHFYKKEECEALGKAVADAVRAALNN